jgi:nifR3 family TIM-barrel protein
MFFLKKNESELQKIFLFSAPICGFSRYPFRKILSEYPVDMIFTEMISIDALYYKNPNTFPLLRFDKKETPTAVQLVGSKMELFINAAEVLQDYGFTAIDINLGCPVKKVLKNEAGSYLLQYPEKIFQIFKTLTDRFPHLSFTGKIRTGFSKSNRNYLEVARAVEEGRGKMLNVHGRTRCQMYSGDIDLEAIREIKKSLSIPVIGNGNIFTPEDALNMIEKTSCDGVMIGRGMLGNPWLFKQIRDYLETGSYQQPDYLEKARMLIQNYNLENDFDPRNGFREYKKIGVKYLKNIPRATEWRKKILETGGPEEMEEVFKELRIFIHEWNENSDRITA